LERRPFFLGWNVVWYALGKKAGRVDLGDTDIRGGKMEKDVSRDLITLPIPELIKRLAVPASVGYFFHTMYNVVDTYFGGLISTQVLAALSLSLPVFFIIIAVCTGISTGTTALIANALGAGDREKAKMLAVQGLAFGIVTSAALTLIGIFSSPYLFSVLGASDAYMVTCLKYMDTIFLGTVLFMLVSMLNAILTALGNTRPYRNFLIAGFLLNIILDPWFIFGGLGLPPLGIIGIALATVVIQGIGCLYLGAMVSRTGLFTKGDLKRLVPSYGPFKEIARQGLPASVNLLTIGLGIFVITYFVSAFGKGAVAAYGVAMRVEQTVLVPAIGLNVATLTIVAQNNGARLFRRVQETIHRNLVYGGIMMAIGAVGILILAPQLMALFTHDKKVIEIGAVYLRIDALALYAYVVLSVNIAALQGMKKPMYALWIGLYRQIVAPFLLFYLLTRVLDVGLIGIWWGIFSITWSATLITIFYARLQLRKVRSHLVDDPPVSFTQQAQPSTACCPKPDRKGAI